VVSPELLSDLVASMPKRCRAVIDNKGCQQNIRMHLITPMTLFRATILISKSYVQKISNVSAIFEKNYVVILLEFSLSLQE